MASKTDRDFVFVTLGTAGFLAAASVLAMFYAWYAPSGWLACCAAMMSPVPGVLAAALVRQVGGEASLHSAAQERPGFRRLGLWVDQFGRDVAHLPISDRLSATECLQTSYIPNFAAAAPPRDKR